MRRWLSRFVSAARQLRIPARLRELEARYRSFGGPAVADPVWTREFEFTIDLRRFRADGPYVWQKELPNLDEEAMRASYAHLRSTDASRLLDVLEEDGAFGARTLEIEGKAVSRDLLDSASELFFLDRHLALSKRAAHGPLSVLDIGAGYGRLAHRALTAFPRLRWTSTDAVATSTWLAERYLSFRGLAERARVIPLDELDDELARRRYSLAVNVHSFSECRPAAIEWWLDRIAGAGVRRLFVVPNAVSADGREPLTNTGESMAPLVAGAGYRLEVVEPKYADPETQRRGLSPTAYFLYSSERG